MRKIILDTETTGLDYKTGDRVIEIGCVELRGRKLSGQRYHAYINPEREIAAGAIAIHGLTNEFLADKPNFATIAAEFADFVRGAELVIHNASFDVGFLNHELGLLGLESIEQLCGKPIDTLKMAREMRPGKKNNLNALCSEYGIDNSGRQLHGALLDAELLAEVYLAMTRGQNSLEIDFDQPVVRTVRQAAVERSPLKIVRASDEEQASHAAVLAEIGKESKGQCLWSSLVATEVIEAPA
jgi:DNA polymerase-3 subunit epsilon